MRSIIPLWQKVGGGTNTWLSGKNDCVSNGQLLHGTYAKKTPYNTCVNAGVDECVIWGDYYFMEALTRLKNPNWEMYW